jgi:hypothetical protein
MTPSRPEADPGRQARDLRAALEGLALALATGDPAAVLDHEPVLRAALSHGPATTPMTDAARTTVRADLDAAVRALAHCRAIGAATAVLVDATLDTLGRTAGYDRHGAGAASPTRARDLLVRV